MALQPSRRFAWDGMSFDVPAGWNLSFQRIHRGVTKLEMEDDTSVRLSAEWLRPLREVDYAGLLRRFEKSSKELRARARDVHPVEGAPAGWSAFVYTMPDDRRLVIAFYLGPRHSVFCFFQLHLDAGPRGEALSIAHRLMASLRLYDGEPVIPWKPYDVEFTVPAPLALQEARLHAGRQGFVFGWRGRRLLVWVFSLADMIVRENPDLAKWTVAFLLASGDVKGPIISARDGRVDVRRKRFPPHYHFHEVGRWCFRYRVGLRHEKDANVIVLTVLNYRFESDLARLLRHPVTLPLAAGPVTPSPAA